MAKSPPRSSPDEIARIEKAKAGSTLQVLFKVSRLLNERAIAGVPAAPGAPRLRASHMSLLPHIDWEGTRLTTLAERLGITKQAVGQLVDEMEALGILERTPDPEDGRARRIAFTPRGRASILDGLARLAALEKELAEAVGERAMATLGATLRRILEHEGRRGAG